LWNAQHIGKKDKEAAKLQSQKHRQKMELDRELTSTQRLEGKRKRREEHLRS
jgi:hypothetical protein